MNKIKKWWVAGTLLLVLLIVAGFALMRSSFFTEIEFVPLTELAELSNQQQLASVAAASIEKMFIKNENPTLSEEGIERVVEVAPRPEGDVEITGQVLVEIHDPVGPVFGSDVITAEEALEEYTVMYIKDDETNQVFELEIQDDVDEDITTSDVITVRGEADSNVIVVDENRGDRGTADIKIVSKAPSVLGIDTSGTNQPYIYKTLMIPANYVDRNLGCTEDSLRQKMQDGPGMTFRTATIEATNGAVGATTVVLPKTTSSFSHSSPDYMAMAYELEQYAEGLGYTLTDYDTILFMLPRNTGYNVGGIGFNGGFNHMPSRAWVYFCDWMNMTQHEIGHNMGFGHAGTPGNPYGEISTPMGGNENRNFHDFTAPYKFGQSWVMPSKVVEDADGVYTLSPSDLYDAESPNPQMLIYDNPTQSFNVGRSIFVSYRQGEGLSQPLRSTVNNQVSIHMYTPSRYNAPSTLYATLEVGESYTDPTGDTTVSYLSTDGLTATVNVIKKGVACTESDPLVTVAPSVFTGEPGAGQTYAITITNQHSATCASEKYTLTPTVPSGWSSNVVSKDTASLKSGTSETINVLVSSSNNAPNGEYTLSFSTAGERSSAVVSSAAHTVVAVIVAPTASLSANPTTLVRGADTTLTWSSADTDTCTGTNFITSSAVGGTKTESPTETTTYSIVCVGAGGTSTKAVTVTVTEPPTPKPTVSLSASPSTIVSGNETVLTWSSTNATGCTGSGFEAANQTGSSVTLTPETTTTYQLSCTGNGGTSNDSTTVTVTPPPPPPPSPTAALSAVPETITRGGVTTLTWSSANAVSCVGSGFSSGGATNGSVDVTPIEETLYTLICTGDGGETEVSTTVTMKEVTEKVVEKVKEKKIREVKIKPIFQGNGKKIGKSAVLVIYEVGTETEVTRVSSKMGSSGEIDFASLDLEEKAYDVEFVYPGYVAERVMSADITKSISLPKLKAGDLNGDGSIGLSDYSAMATKWFKADLTADFNDDGVVNSLDFSMMSKNFGS